MLFARPDYAILFVCTANICRSPMAQALLQHLCVVHGLNKRVRVDSAGTHVSMRGHRPDPRAVDILKARGVDIGRLRARPLDAADFERFDKILVMEQSHLSYITGSYDSPGRADLDLVMEYADGHSEKQVPDPYYGSRAAFERVFSLLDDACTGIVDKVLLPRFIDRGVHDI